MSPTSMLIFVLPCPCFNPFRPTRCPRKGSDDRTHLPKRSTTIIWVPKMSLLQRRRREVKALQVSRRVFPPKKPLGIPPQKTGWLVRIVGNCSERFCLKKDVWENKETRNGWVDKEAKSPFGSSSLSNLGWFQKMFLPLDWLVTHEWKKNSGSLGNLVN